MPTPHIEALESEISNKVIMPGDPKRAEYIANTFLTDVKKVNSIREEYAFTGLYKGQKITVFSSGMGIPSMGIYSYELFNNYNVDYIIRIGTAGTYTKDIELSSMFLADSSYSETAYDEITINENINVISASLELNTIIEKVAEEKGYELKKGRVHTTDAFYGYEKINSEAVKNDAFVVEMETYALFLNAKKFHKAAASILTISDSLVTKEFMSPEDRVTKVNHMIILALESLIKI